MIHMDIKEVRKKIFDRDGNKCYKCESTNRLSMDHVNPKSKFHYHGVDNILTLCWKCNKSKNINVLPQGELEEIKKYLDEVNQRFTISEASEMQLIIEEHFTKPKKTPRKKKHIENDISTWREYRNTHTWNMFQKFLNEHYIEIKEYESLNSPCGGF